MDRGFLSPSLGTTPFWLLIGKIMSTHVTDWTYTVYGVKQCLRNSIVKGPLTPTRAPVAWNGTFQLVCKVGPHREALKREREERRRKRRKRNLGTLGCTEEEDIWRGSWLRRRKGNMTFNGLWYIYIYNHVTLDSLKINWIQMSSW